MTAVARKRPSLDPKDYPKPKKWFKGFVSQRQERKFKRTSKLKKFYDGMMANTPRKGDSAKARINRLPARVKRKKR